VRYSFEGVDNRRRFDLSLRHPGQDPWCLKRKLRLQWEAGAWWSAASV
jgi:hypothetical protein